jgi:SAM-dependent methyltransferase
MSLGVWFAQLPQWLSLRLYPLLRYTNLMRAIEMHHLAPWVRNVHGWRILDVGCGNGFYSLDFARRDASLIGCDLSRADLIASHQTAEGLGLDGRAAYMVADGSVLPLARGVFDLVFCNCVLEHVVDDRQALVEMYRALRPGGLLYLTVDSAEHGLVLRFMERLPAAVKALLLAPQVAAAPTVSSGLNARLDDRYHVLRRYHCDALTKALRALGLTVLASRPYLTGIGAAQYEAFHALRVDPQGGFGRLLYMLTSLLLYPLAVWSDNRRGAQGYGLAIVARKEEKDGLKDQTKPLPDCDRGIGPDRFHAPAGEDGG